MIITSSKCSMAAKKPAARQRSLLAVCLALSFLIHGNIASSSLLAKRAPSSLDDPLPKLRAVNKFDAGEAVEGFHLRTTVISYGDFLRSHLPPEDHNEFGTKLINFCREKRSPQPTHESMYALSDLLQHLYAYHYAQTGVGYLKPKWSPMSMVKSIMGNKHEKEVMLGDFLNNMFPQGKSDDQRALFISRLNSKYELNFKEEEDSRNFYLLRDLISNLCFWLYVDSQKLPTVSFILNGHVGATEKLLKEARLNGMYDFAGPLWPPMPRQMLEHFDGVIAPIEHFYYAESHSTLNAIQDRFDFHILKNLQESMKNYAWEDFMTTPDRVSKRTLEKYYKDWKDLHGINPDVIASRAQYHVKKLFPSKKNPL